MQRIGAFIWVFLFAACISCISCISEIKPILKPREVGIAARIADQQKWLDQDIAARKIQLQGAKPVRDKLKQIKEKYDRLKSAGALTASDSKEINRMLDQTSDRIFRLNMREQTNVGRKR